jgi:hypothetical protein
MRAPESSGVGSARGAALAPAAGMSRCRSEEGSILIQVAIGLLVLMGFTAFVMDQGVRFVARSQTQNLADAGALAGAIAWAFDEPTAATPSPNGLVEESIEHVVNDQYVLGVQQHGLTYSWDCPPEPIIPAGVTRCVVTNVFRDGTNGGTVLPVFFAQAFGLTQQITRATATAIGGDADGTSCLKPWLIPDKWNEMGGNPNAFDMGIDSYTAPGWTLADIGTVLTLTPGGPAGAISASDFYEIETARDYEESIAGCLLTMGIGDTTTALPGHRVGPTNSGLATLLAAGKPVTVVIGMFSPIDWINTPVQHGTRPNLPIVNMLGFRIDPAYRPHGPQTITGTIVAAPGELLGGVPPGAGAAFLKVIRLVQ